jgi:hypothetical protein
MATSKTDAEIIDFPKEASKKASSTERIWGKAVYKHGYTGIPSILIQAQKRLGINAMQMNIIVQLLDYFFEPSRKPFPTKRELSNRITSPKRRFRSTSGCSKKPG